LPAWQNAEKITAGILTMKRSPHPNENDNTTENPFDLLPAEVLYIVLEYLQPKERARMCEVSKRFNELVNDWENLKKPIETAKTLAPYQKKGLEKIIETHYNFITETKNKKNEEVEFSSEEGGETVDQYSALQLIEQGILTKEDINYFQILEPSSKWDKYGRVVVPSLDLMNDGATRKSGMLFLGVLSTTVGTIAFAITMFSLKNSGLSAYRLMPC